VAKLKIGSVYFVRVGDHVKVGFTTSLKRRLAEIQTCNPYPLEFLAVISQATPSLEGVFHRIWRGRRAQGEWFWLGAEVTHVIDAIIAGAQPRNAAQVRALLPKKEIRRKRILRKIKQRQYFEDVAEQRSYGV
jgi:hypothetical protein